MKNIHQQKKLFHCFLHYEPKSLKVYLSWVCKKQGSSGILKFEKWIDYTFNLLNGDLLPLWMELWLYYSFLSSFFPSCTLTSVYYTNTDRDHTSVCSAAIRHATCSHYISSSFFPSFRHREMTCVPKNVSSISSVID